MREFDKWFAQITKEYPLYQDGEGYNIGNTRALRVGWRAALRMVLGEVNSLNFHDTFSTVEEAYISVIHNIQKELEEE